MKILFVMRHSGYVRNFEWVLRLLADRGHTVHLGFELERPQAEVAERLERETGGAVTHGYVPVRTDVWRQLALALRQGIDYLRYLEPEYREATKLRLRATRGGTPPILVRLTARRRFRSQRVVHALAAALRLWERNLPLSREILDFVRTSGASMVWATPLVAGHSQYEYMRAAHALGLPTVLPVNSWDNLTNKGLVHEPFPDRVYVWNETQRREAVVFHRLARESVVAVGAHTYDHWFDWRPSTSRDDFCRKVGLDASRPFLLYVCSSVFIARNEQPVVARWLAALRSDPVLRDVGVLVRPHPSSGHTWSEHAFRGEPQVAVWPPTGADPRVEGARQDYFDSMHHAAAVVGMNTSALIEAAIAGRRTYTVTLPELRETQEGTLHFHYLMRENGGPLTVARSLEEHAEHLRQALTAIADGDWNRAFLESFIRPYGLDRAGAPRLVEDVERLAREFEPSPARRPRRLVVLLSLPLARLAERSDYAIKKRKPRSRRGYERALGAARRLALRTRSAAAAGPARVAPAREER